MKLLKIPLKAGQHLPIGRGRFVRVFDAVHPITIKTQALAGKSNQDTLMIANMGAEFVPFEKADLVSDYDQVILIAYSEMQIFDNRLGAENGTTLQTVAPQTTRLIENYAIDNSTRVKILNANTKRKNALVATNAEVTFYNDQAGGSGFKINGDFDEQSNSELWAIATSAALIEVMEFSHE